MLKPIFEPRPQLHGEAAANFQFDDLDHEHLSQMNLPPMWKAAYLKARPSQMRPQEIYWHDDSYVLAFGATQDELSQIRAETGGSFWTLHLREQCAILGMEFETVERADLERDSSMPAGGKKPRVEDLVLNSIQRGDVIADRSEGAAFYLLHAVISCLASAKWRAFCEKHLGHSADLPKALPDGMGSWNLPEAFELFSPYFDIRLAHALLSDHETAPLPIWKLVNRNIKWELVEALWQPRMRETTLKILHQRFNAWSGMGWPDITAISESGLSFVEVKARGDRFTHNQPNWARRFVRPLGLRVKVLQVL